MDILKLNGDVDVDPKRCCWSDGSQVDLYRVRRIVDEHQSTLAQSIENRVDMAGQDCRTSMDSTCRPVELMSGQSTILENLGVLIDGNMTLSSWVNNITGICFYQLHQ